MWWVVLALGVAVAGGPPSGAPVSDMSQQAEYVRLAEELNKAMTRNNWVAVERLFGKLEAVGVPHTRTPLYNAGLAAMQRGEIAVARSRLIAAQKLEETDDVGELLWTIQRSYGPVMLAADLPANYRLECEVMPFGTIERAAVKFAKQSVLEDSYFEGLIPRGEYSFQPYLEDSEGPSFKFTLRADRQRFDLRTREEPTGADRKKRARIDRKIARREAKSKS